MSKTDFFLKLAKVLSLLTPFALTIILFFTVLFPTIRMNYSRAEQEITHYEGSTQLQMEAEFQQEIMQIENKVTILLSVVGLAVTVWVSLNIYNVIERKQVDLLIEQAQRLGDTISTLTENEQKLSAEIQNLKKELDESVNNLLQNQEILEKDIASGVKAQWG